MQTHQGCAEAIPAPPKPLGERMEIVAAMRHDVGGFVANGGFTSELEELIPRGADRVALGNVDGYSRPYPVPFCVAAWPFRAQMKDVPGWRRQPAKMGIYA